MGNDDFATVINCMDGRTQIPVNEWVRAEIGATHVDTITEAGPNGILANRQEPLASTIRDRVMISVNDHGSKTIALVGHYDCAGNPGPKTHQKGDVLKGLETIRSWGLPVRLIGLLVGDDWSVEVVADSGSAPNRAKTGTGAVA